jgi:organic hydroperoxide reductase OsmC/OhrA
MSYQVTVSWQKKSDEAFVDNHYSRVHTWKFDGGIEVAASSSPHVVPLPMSSEAAVDPEEAFIASISSCHMLWFLSIAAEENYIVERYEDQAEGILGKDAEGKLAMTKVTLKPKVVFNPATIPSREQVDELHHLAHEKCFIANSVKTKITILEETWGPILTTF